MAPSGTSDRKSQTPRGSLDAVDGCGKSPTDVKPVTMADRDLFDLGALEISLLLVCCKDVEFEIFFPFPRLFLGLSCIAVFKGTLNMSDGNDSTSGNATHVASEYLRITILALAIVLLGTPRFYKAVLPGWLFQPVIRNAKGERLPSEQSDTRSTRLSDGKNLSERCQKEHGPLYTVKNGRWNEVREAPLPSKPIRLT